MSRNCRHCRPKPGGIRATKWVMICTHIYPCVYIYAYVPRLWRHCSPNPGVIRAAESVNELPRCRSNLQSPSRPNQLSVNYQSQVRINIMIYTRIRHKC